MTRVALLWHMHQPFYQDLVTGDHILPWVRLHALKDYWGMVALLREFPTVKVTFNLVPSLLVQLEAFANEQARDRHLEIGLAPAASLNEDERAFCVEHYFHAQHQRMIEPHPRYAELLAKRGHGGGLSARAKASQFSADDLRDLQVWHKLVWVDRDFGVRDARIQGLMSKGRKFSENDKLVLRAVELELLRSVVPEYRDASARGQVELSTSPFYHPILPLLCDTDTYLRTHPQSRMPRERFRHPEDAQEQLNRAVALHQRLFGERPEGVWPSEGSVSDEMVPLVAQAGFQWMATDEGILSRTLGHGFTRGADGLVDRPELLYRAYRVGGSAGVACGFRDHALSDLIGFTYASWSADAAAGDFSQRLVDAGRRYAARTGGGEATIFVILDGENAWEHYDQQGRPFLRALYSRLAHHPDLRTVTMAEACQSATEVLPAIFPGSWINSDFYIWIGHSDDHRAWNQLAEARQALDAPPPGIREESLAQAQEELLIAQGSDWFWWYGDDHSSDHDQEFDELFRRHLRNVYQALGKPIPDELFATNISTQPPAGEIQRPTGFIQPILDGEVTSYFEWLGAGCVDAVPVAGAMHQVAELGVGLTLVEFGFDLKSLYIRADGAGPMRQILSAGLDLSVSFLTPSGLRILVRVEGEDCTARLLKPGPDGAPTPTECLGLQVGVGTIAELRIPFASIGLQANDPVGILVALSRESGAPEHHPRHRLIEFMVPDHRFGSLNWTT
jgi:alpha-amylase/alpha-mannosidase (GH57 family)